MRIRVLGEQNVRGVVIKDGAVGQVVQKVRIIFEKADVTGLNGDFPIFDDGILQIMKHEVLP